MSDRKYRLLLVDDSHADLRLVREILRAWKTRHNVDVAEDGTKAIRFLENRNNDRQPLRPDLVLLDLNMPRMDGFAVLKWIRAHEDADFELFR